MPKNTRAHLRACFESQIPMFDGEHLPPGWRLVAENAGLRLPPHALLAAHRDGRLGVAFGEFKLTVHTNPHGYRVVHPGETVHRIVCATFHGAPPFAGAQVRHLDGNLANNHADNLAWGTCAENHADRRGHGRTLGRGVERERIALDLHYSLLKGPLQLWSWGLPPERTRMRRIAALRALRGLAKRGPFGTTPPPAPPAPTLPGSETWPPSDPGPPDWPPGR